MSLKHIDAFILAGGQSRRLNRDKVHLELPTGRVLANLAHLCQGLFREVLFVVDRADRIRRPHPGVRVIADEIPGSGPLGGLLAALDASASTVSFVIACDLPFLHGELIRFIARRISSQDVLVPRWRGGVEPLVGFYSKTCAEAIRASIKRGDLRVRAFWPEVRTEIVELDAFFDDEDLRTWLLNVNTRHDLEIAEAVASAGTRE